MPAKSLNKVQKSVAKKKGRGAALHERSRDARRIKQASRRQDKLAVLAARTDQTQRPYLDRMLFLQEAVEGRKEGVDDVQLKQLAEDFIARNDDRLKELESTRRKGRPPSTEETNLKQRRGVEQSEYAAGLWMPDLRNPKNIELLQAWQGAWSGLGTIGFSRVASDGSIQSSAFPPKSGH